MAKAIIKFKKNKVRPKRLLSRGQKRTRFILMFFFLLIAGNFAWDGLEREKQIAGVYELGKEYYDIIATETRNSLISIKKQIDSPEKGK